MEVDRKPKREAIAYPRIGPNGIFVNDDSLRPRKSKTRHFPDEKKHHQKAGYRDSKGVDKIVVYSDDEGEVEYDSPAYHRAHPESPGHVFRKAKAQFVPNGKRKILMQKLVGAKRYISPQEKKTPAKEIRAQMQRAAIKRHYERVPKNSEGKRDKNALKGAFRDAMAEVKEEYIRWKQDHPELVKAKKVKKEEPTSGKRKAPNQLKRE